MNNFAHLKKDSPWYPLFPNGAAPIRNILLPRAGVMEGDNNNQPQEFYDLDLSKLSPNQILKITQMVAGQCGGTEEEVRRDIFTRGFIPLRAIHVASVSSDCPAFL